jgi:hypothetical protein
MPNHDLLRLAKLCKAACALNVATLLRAARFGLRDAASKAVGAYNLIDPLGEARLRRADPRVWNLLPAVPEVRLSDVVTAMPSIILDDPSNYIDGTLPLRDRLALMAVVCDRGPCLVLEIGTYNGSTTRLIASNLPGSSVHTLDLPGDLSDEDLRNPDFPKDDFHLIAKRRVGEAFLRDPSITNITQHLGDSATWDFSPVRGADFIFIDGSHTYKYVKNDTIRSAEAAADRATIMWHDFNPNQYDVVRYLSELADAGLPVRHIESTSMAILDYDRSLHLPKIRAAGDGQCGDVHPRTEPAVTAQGTGR